MDTPSVKNVSAHSPDLSVQNGIPLSSVQEVVWLDQILHPELTNYNIGSIATIEGEMDLAALPKALTAVIERHDALRLQLVAQDKPEQYITSERTIRLDFVDYSAQDAPSSSIDNIIKSTFTAPFRLDGQLWRSLLIRDSETRWYWLFCCHHLIADGMSLSLINDEIAANYSAIINGEELVGNPAQSYVDYLEEDKAYLCSARYIKDQQFWMEKYKTLPPALLPPLVKTEAETGITPEPVVWTLSGELLLSIEELAAAHGFSTLHFMYALFACYFNRVNNTDDVVIGIPLHNRRNASQKKAVGMYASVIPVRVNIIPSDTFIDIMRKVSVELRQCYKHQRMPIAEINWKAQIQQKAGRSHLFDMTLSFEAYVAGIHMEGATVCAIEPHHRAQYPLGITINQYIYPNGSPTGQPVTVEFNFSGDYLTAEGVMTMQSRLSVLLDGVLKNSDSQVACLPILSDAERQQLLPHGHEASEAMKHHGLIHHLFEQHVTQTPDAIAVIFEDQSLRYDELNRRANKLAYHLIALGVSPNDRVAICLDRGLDMVVGILGILKAGGAYVPLDPVYPIERLTYMLEDSAPVALVTDVLLAERVSYSTEVVLIDQLLSSTVESDVCRNPSAEMIGLSAHHLAYVIYTSGSTGQPKGVVVEHGNVTRLLSVTQPDFNFSRNDVWTLFHSFSFDFSVWELFGALCYGSKLVVVSPVCARSPEAFYALICREKVTVLNQTPSAFRQLIAAQSEEPHALRCIVFGGEALEMRTLVPWINHPLNDNTKLINMYGITEITVHATYYEITRTDITAHRASLIGHPLADLSIYILDNYGQLAPIGAVGELYIAGDGVARGYLNLPALTAERFLPDPFSQQPGTRMYKTGDLGRWLPEGNIEYLGRNDFQVKIRGFRIELGEIEAALAACEGVSEVVVIAREDSPGDKRLVAYLLPEPGYQPEPAALRRQLAVSLAEYMLPAAYVVVTSFPLTPNGKLDRRALPAPDQHAVVSQRYVAPVNDREQRLAAVWRELLGVTQVGRDDNFFELGGHSLMVVSLLERLRTQGLSLDIRTAFSAPVLSEMALRLTDVEAEDDALSVPPVGIPEHCTQITPEMLPLVSLTQDEIAAVVATVEGGVANVQDIYPLSPLQEGIVFHHLLQEEGDTYLLHSLLGFDSRDRLDTFLQALQQVIDRHDILRSAACWQGITHPVQVVWRHAPLQVNAFIPDGEADIATQLLAYINPRRRRIALDKAPLFSADTVYDPQRGQWLLALCFHHLVCDHISMALICGEITALLAGGSTSLPVSLPYRDFIAHTQRTPPAVHEAYFRSLLGDVDTPTAPFGILDIQESGGRTGEMSLPLDSTLSGRVRSAARALGVSPGVLFHTACARVLSQLCGHDDVVFGTVLMGRLQGGSSAERGMGIFINTLPLRVQLAEKSVHEAVQETFHGLTGLFEHEQAPLALALRCSSVPQPLPLFSAILNYRHSLPGVGTELWAGMTLLETEERTNYPLTYAVDDLGEGFVLTAQTVEGIDAGRMTAYLMTAMSRLLEALHDKPSRPILSLPILPEGERRQLLEEFNSPRRPFPGESLIHSQFEVQVRRTPDAIAVEEGTSTLSYDALNRKANRLAHALLGLGVRPDDRVALCIGRSVPSVVSMLAVLKAGGAYVPLDPAAPAERLNYMLEDAAPVAVITEQQWAENLASGLPTLLIDELIPGSAESESNPDPWRIGLTSRHLAYVIYTSGSTGQPKGVMVEHINVNHLALNNGIADIGPDDCIAHCANIAFDASTWEVWSALLNGARLHVVSTSTLLNPPLLCETLIEANVTAMWLTVGLFNKYINDLTPVFGKLRYLLIGGDVLDPQKIAELQQATQQPQRVINGYGPTETTTFATSFAIVSPVDPSRAIPIGKPISNTQVYILDEHGQPAPLGVSGEIYISGEGVARGYLNQPVLTAERFLPNPFIAGQRMYKSGDLGRWLPDGNIDYLGRNDFQVKIRGFRIELGEIETALTACEGVRQAAVIVREDSAGDKRLVAYLLPENGCQPLPAELRRQLSLSLADYMLPSAYVVMESFPLTANGKLDRRALPEPDQRAMMTQDYVAPIGEIENGLALIWEELLSVTQIGRHDNFFELGGHSLMAVQLINRIQSVFLVDISISSLFISPTLLELAKTIFTAQMNMIEEEDIAEIQRALDAMSVEELAKMMDEELLK